MKSLIQLIVTSIVALFILAITITAALADEGCTEACYNEGHPYCSPSDETCEFVGSDCSVEADSDADGWTDTCDAFPLDDSEWVDLDGDESGHNNDCNDFDSTIYPKAVEVCGNDIDENCDGIDEECPECNSNEDCEGLCQEGKCVDYSCTDSDNDGYFVNEELCPSGNDCDDSNKNMNPGASEVCSDGIDNDCDGSVDEGCSSSSSSSSKSSPRRTSGSSSGISGGDWDRCKSEWDCTSDCTAGTIECVDLNSCELALNKPTEPDCPSEPAVEEQVKEPVVEAVAPELEEEEQPPQEEQEKKAVIPIVGNAVRDTGNGGNLWPLLGLFLIFVPWKKCSKCGTRHMLTRSHCTKCNNVFYKVKKNSFLYKVRHLPFL